MPGNVPNISQDTLDAVKNYTKVTLQQGVPITDSDWNELQDIAFVRMIQQNMATFGDCRLAPGPSSRTPGFVCVGDGSSNNFRITPGLACVSGLIVPSQHWTTEPSADIWYDGSDNHMMNGEITAIGSGTITDENTRYEPHMDVVGCRISPTSGIETGNIFTISARIDETTLQISGGIGSMAPGDQYLMLPPELTTPPSSRVDEVYIHVWLDDTNAEEDNILLNPALNMEPSHRNKIRSVVRVAEGGITPATPDPMSTGVRYMKIATINRSPSDVIYAWYVVPEANAVMKAGLGSSDIQLEDPQLIWRSLGWRDDADITANTHSIYMWGSRLIMLRGAYISVGRIWTGAEAATPIWMSSNGEIYTGPYTPSGTDMGYYYSSSTWSAQYTQSNTAFTVSGGRLEVASRILMNDGAEIQLDDGASIVGDYTAETSARQLFKMEVGLEFQIHYTDREMWWLINTVYDRDTETFVSITPASGSYMMRFVSGAIQMRVYGYSSTPWGIDDWSHTVTLDPSRVFAQDHCFTREMQSYSSTQERTFGRYPGFLLVRMTHATQGTHVAMFRTEDNQTVFEMVSGNSSYFDPQYGHAGTVNVYPTGGDDDFLIQNNVGQTVQIGYGYMRISDI